MTGRKPRNPRPLTLDTQNAVHPSRISLSTPGLEDRIDTTLVYCLYLVVLLLHEWAAAQIKRSLKQLWPLIPNIVPMRASCDASWS